MNDNDGLPEILIKNANFFVYSVYAIEYFKILHKTNIDRYYFFYIVYVIEYSEIIHEINIDEHKFVCLQCVCNRIFWNHT